MTLLAVPSSPPLTLPRWLPLAAVFVLAVVVRHVVVANSDVSWGLTMAEKWLDGQRLYVDVVEVNPPATVFLYVVPAAFGRLLGLPAEITCDALVFAAIALSLWLGTYILRQGGVIVRDGQWPLVTTVGAVLTILPAQSFAEREHIGLILFLPLLAAAAVRAEGSAPGTSMTIVVGIAAGLLTIIKPHFAAAIVFTAGAAAFWARSWRPLLALENWIAALSLAAYGVVVAVAFPRFVSDVLPLLLDVYIPVKLPFATLIVFFATPIWVAALLTIWWLKRGAMLKPPFCLLLAASAGFSVPYYVQQKGWSYHSYPMIALALIALALAFVDRWHRARADAAAGRPQRLASLLVGAVIAGVSFFWMNVAVDCSALAGPIRALKPHPKILALSADLATGHPLTRQVEGIWVSRVSAQWITTGAYLRRMSETLDPALDARLEADTARDRAMLTEDIARNRPDVILVQLTDRFDWLAWARSDPALAAQTALYHPYMTLDNVLVLRRAESSSGPSPRSHLAAP
jgi:hypothetical protein